MPKSSPVAAPVVADPPVAAVCCSPLVREPLSVEQAERVAPLLRALGDPVTQPAPPAEPEGARGG